MAGPERPERCNGPCDLDRDKRPQEVLTAKAVQKLPLVLSLQPALCWTPAPLSPQCSNLIKSDSNCGILKAVHVCKQATGCTLEL